MNSEPRKQKKKNKKRNKKNKRQKVGIPSWFCFKLYSLSVASIFPRNKSVVTVLQIVDDSECGVGKKPKKKLRL